MKNYINSFIVIFLILCSPKREQNVLNKKSKVYITKELEKHQINKKVINEILGKLDEKCPISIDIKDIKKIFKESKTRHLFNNQNAIRNVYNIIHSTYGDIHPSYQKQFSFSINEDKKLKNIIIPSDIPCFFKSLLINIDINLTSIFHSLEKLQSDTPKIFTIFAQEILEKTKEITKVYQNELNKYINTLKNLKHKKNKLNEYEKKLEELKNLKHKNRLNEYEKKLEELKNLNIEIANNIRILNRAGFRFAEYLRFILYAINNPKIFDTSEFKYVRPDILLQDLKRNFEIKNIKINQLKNDCLILQSKIKSNNINKFIIDNLKELPKINISNEYDFKCSKLYPFTDNISWKWEWDLENLDINFDVGRQKFNNKNQTDGYTYEEEGIKEYIETNQCKLPSYLQSDFIKPSQTFLNLEYSNSKPASCSNELDFILTNDDNNNITYVEFKSFVIKDKCKAQFCNKINNFPINNLIYDLKGNNENIKNIKSMLNEIKKENYIPFDIYFIEDHDYKNPTRIFCSKTDNLKNKLKQKNNDDEKIQDTKGKENIFKLKINNKFEQKLNKNKFEQKLNKNKSEQKLNKNKSGKNSKNNKSGKNSKNNKSSKTSNNKSSKTSNNKSRKISNNKSRKKLNKNKSNHKSNKLSQIENSEEKCQQVPNITDNIRKNLNVDTTQFENILKSLVKKCTPEELENLMTEFGVPHSFLREMKEEYEKAKKINDNSLTDIGDRKWGINSYKLYHYLIEKIKNTFLDYWNNKKLDNEKEELASNLGYNLTYPSEKIEVFNNLYFSLFEITKVNCFHNLDFFIYNKVNNKLFNEFISKSIFFIKKCYLNKNFENKELNQKCYDNLKDQCRKRRIISPKCLEIIDDQHLHVFILMILQVFDPKLGGIVDENIICERIPLINLSRFIKKSFISKKTYKNLLKDLRRISSRYGCNQNKILNKQLVDNFIKDESEFILKIVEKNIAYFNEKNSISNLSLPEKTFINIKEHFYKGQMIVGSFPFFKKCFDEISKMPELKNITNKEYLFYTADTLYKIKFSNTKYVKVGEQYHILDYKCSRLIDDKIEKTLQNLIETKNNQIECIYDLDNEFELKIKIDIKNNIYISLCKYNQEIPILEEKPNTEIKEETFDLIKIDNFFEESFVNINNNNHDEKMNICQNTSANDEFFESYKNLKRQWCYLLIPNNDENWEYIGFNKKFCSFIEQSIRKAINQNLKKAEYECSEIDIKKSYLRDFKLIIKIDNKVDVFLEKKPGDIRISLCLPPIDKDPSNKIKFPPNNKLFSELNEFLDRMF